MSRIVLGILLFVVAHAADAIDGRTIAYTPLRQTADAIPDRASLHADAAALGRVFRTAVTDDAFPLVCRAFRKRGFTTVLVGIRDPADAAALRAARRQRRCADGYVVGSGGLLRRRYRRADVDAAVAALRATGRPVGVRETLRAFRRDPSLYQVGDWAMPIVHPAFGEHPHPQTACGWMLHRGREAAARAPGRTVVFTEVGFPTAGAPALSENYQRAFFGCIETRQVPFAYGAAFDEPWRAPSSPDAHLGLFRADGTPKQWAALQAPPGIDLAVTGTVARGRVTNLEPGRAAVVVWALTGGWRAVGRAVPDRRGRWRLRVPLANGYAAAAVAPKWTPQDTTHRLPPVDGESVLARSDTGALGTGQRP